MLRPRSDFVAAALCVMISLPAFALGHRLRDADPSAMVLAGMLLAVVVLASAIMKQVESASTRTSIPPASDSD
jgi:hypothetical protein